MRLVGLLMLALFLAMPATGIGKERPSVSKKRWPLTGSYVLKRTKGAGGVLLVKQVSPNRIEFELNCNRGAPSYNMGIARATVDIKNGVAVYRTTEFTGPCELKLAFKGTRVVVSQTGSDSDCGFGHGVYCDGVYRLKSRKAPKFEAR